MGDEDIRVSHLDDDLVVVSVALPSVADDRLTPSERSVADGIVRGLSNADIARVRSVSTRTVANQVASILRKLGAASRADLVARLRRRSS